MRAQCLACGLPGPPGLPTVNLPPLALGLGAAFAAVFLGVVNVGCEVFGRAVRGMIGAPGVECIFTIHFSVIDEPDFREGTLWRRGGWRDGQRGERRGVSPPVMPSEG